MKKTILKIVNYLVVSTVSIILILILLYVGLRFIPPITLKDHSRVQRLISKIIQRPIKIRTIKFSGAGIDPQIKLYQVDIFNSANTHQIAKIAELDVNIDLLTTLFDLRIVPKFLKINGAEFDCFQQGDNNALSAATTQQQVRGMVAWLFNQKKVYLTDINFNYHTAGDVFNFSNMNIHLTDTLSGYKIAFDGDLLDGKVSPLRGKIIIYGNPINLASKISGNATISNVFLKKMSQLFALSNVQVRSGRADVNIDFALNGDQLQNANLKLSVRDCVFQTMQKYVVNLHQLTGNIQIDRASNGWGIVGKYNNVELNIDNNFKYPLWLTSVYSDYTLNYSNAGAAVVLNKVVVSNNDFSLLAHGDVLLAKNKSPKVDIKAKYSFFNIKKLPNYYPRKIMHRPLLDWLDNGIIDGKTLTGELAFNNGKFYSASTLNDITLQYNRGWPQFKHIDGKIIFANKSMQINAAATTLDNPVNNIKVTIPDLSSPLLLATGDIDTHNDLAMQFVNNSPLRFTVGKKLNNSELTGPVAVLLKLSIPLGHRAGKTKVIGKIIEMNGDMVITDWNLHLKKIFGTLDFTGNSLSANNLSAVLFSQPIKIELATLDKDKKDSLLRVNINGAANMEAVNKQLQLPALHFMHGIFAYQAVLNLYKDTNGHTNSLNLDSDLDGLLIDLPQPLAKPMKKLKQLHLSASFADNAPLKVMLKYGHDFNSAFLINKKVDKFNLYAAVMRFGGDAAFFPEKSGLYIDGYISKLNLSQWKTYVSANDTHGNNILRDLNLTVGELDAFDSVFYRMNFSANKTNDGLDIHAINSNIDGIISIPSRYPKLPMAVNFKKLTYFHKNDKVSSPFLRPDKMPNLDFSAHNVLFNKKHLKYFAFQARPNKTGVDIDKLNLVASNFRITAKGNWSELHNKQSSDLKGEFFTDDLGGLLKALKKTDNLVGGNGDIAFDLRWSGALYNPALAVVSGNLTLNFKEGRIINLSRKTQEEIGWGRLLNVFSLQSLPKRLTLNFDDLTKQGFIFDKLYGDINLDDGEMNTDDVALSGSVAHITASGRVGLLNKNFDLALTMIPHVTSSLPVLVALAGGPVAGAVTWFADQVFEHTLQKATTYRYKVTGSWEHPKIVRLYKNYEYNLAHSL